MLLDVSTKGEKLQNRQIVTASGVVGLLVAAPLVLALAVIRVVSPETGPVFLVIAVAALLASIVLIPLLWRRSRGWPERLGARFCLVQVVWGLVFGLAWVAVMLALTTAVLRSGADVAFEIMGWEFLVGFWIYLAVAGMVFAGRAQLRQASLERVVADAKLAALVSKLQPHFLFNILTSIIELIDASPAEAERAIDDLALLLRRAINLDPGQEVALSEELGFVERYLALERLRLGTRLETRTTVSDDALARPVPAFGVQTLVENAVRHGVAPDPTGGIIELRAAVQDGTLRVVVSDSGPGCDPDAVGRGSGRGLAMLREVLKSRHGEHAGLSVATAPGAGFSVTLEVPE